jgi:hypothetical protein
MLFAERTTSGRLSKSQRAAMNERRRMEQEDKMSGVERRMENLAESKDIRHLASVISSR